MKHLRKITAVVLSVALLLTPTTALFAADPTVDTNTDKVATLRDLGLYAGTDPSAPTTGLEGQLTTQDSLIFLAKLFGYTEAANALTADQTAEALAKFDDAASISDYAKKVIAYSASQGIIRGMTDGEKFYTGAKDTVTAARFATFMLKQMGYTVADYKVSVAKLAETKGSKVDATLTGDLTRDAAIGAMFGALTAEKASGKTVIADIVGDKADLKAIAEKAGLFPTVAESENLRVESVHVMNNKQVEINFNLQMDKTSAQDKTNYKIRDRGVFEKTLTNNSCKLSDDEKTILITLDSTVTDRFTNNSIAKIIVSKDILAANGKTLGTEEAFDAAVLDGILPTVAEVKDIGEKHISISFSEPVYENANSNSLNITNFKVKSGTYTYPIQEASLTLDVIHLELGTKLIEGPVTVTVNAAGLSGNNAIQDYAGYKVFKGDHVFTYVRDTSVPVVTVTTADKNEVVLHFSKPVKGSNIKLYYSEKGKEDNKAEATTSGKYVDEISFVFDTLLPIGAQNLYLVGSTTDADKMIDRYGIKVPDQMLACEIKDTTAPSLAAGAVRRTSDTEGTIAFTSTEKGMYYYSIADAGAEPTVDASGVGQECTTAETSIINPTGLTAGAKYIHIKAKDAAGNVSPALKIAIPAFLAPYDEPTYVPSKQEQPAPIGLAGVAPTTAGSGGKITGTTVFMEYKLTSAADSAYIACSDMETVGVAAGEYAVRLAAKTGFFSGAITTVTVPAYVPDPYIPDTSVPVITVTTAGAVTRTSDTEGTVTFTVNEAGRYYYSIVEDGAAEPSIDTSGDGAVCTTAATTIPIALTSGAKDVYIKVKDAAGNRRSAMKIDISAYNPPTVFADGITETQDPYAQYVLITFVDEDGIDTAVSHNVENYDIRHISISKFLMRRHKYEAYN